MPQLFDTQQNSTWTLARLVQDVLHLNDVVVTSRTDSTLMKSGFKLNYLVDPAVLNFYAHPRDWTNLVAALPVLLDDDATRISDLGEDLPLEETEPANGPKAGRSADPLLEATALLTSEYIFSTNFVGPGQFLYVAPDHMAEFLDGIDRIGRRVKAHTAALAETRPNLYRQLSDRLGVESHRHEDYATPVEDYVRRTRDILIEQLAGVSHSELLAPMRLDRLLKKSILSNAQSSLSFDAEVIGPPFALVEWFSDEIRRQKLSNKTRPSPDAIESDAVVLSQLVLLNRNWEKDKKVYLLVTQDRGLHAAYHAYNTSKETVVDIGSGFFPLRYPRQYIPILNVHDMGGQLTESKIFEVVERATDTIADLFSRAVPAEWNSLGQSRFHRTGWIHSLLAKSGAGVGEFSAILKQQTDELARTWTDLFKDAVAAKSDVIDELLQAEGAHWRKFVNSDLRNAFESRVADFERSFSRVAISSVFLLRHEIWAMELAAKKSDYDYNGGDFGRRVVPTRFDSFQSTEIRWRKLSELVETLPHEGAAGLRRLESVDRAERLLIGGALCLDIGAWSASTNLLQKSAFAAASSFKTSPELASEIEFFLAVSRRLSATGRDWRSRYEASQTALDRLLEIASSDFDQSRIQSEMLALSLCALAWEVDLSGSSSNSAAIQYFWEAFSLLESLQRILDEEPADAAAARIRNQVALNTFDLFFWGYVLRVEDATLTTRVLKELARYRPLHSDDVGPHERIYPTLAEFVLGTTDEAFLLSCLSGASDQKRNRHFAFNLPEVDKLEFQKIGIYLARN